MKLFATDFKKEHDGFRGAVAYRFSFRVKEAKEVRIAFRVGSPADIQAYADMLAQDEHVLSAAAEYLYSIELDKIAKISPIKSEEEVAYDETFCGS